MVSMSTPVPIRMAFRLFPGRMVLISDALRCCGMPDGEYELGGQPVFLQGKTCTLADGTLAGSVTNLYDCMCNAISYGIAPEEAIRRGDVEPGLRAGRGKRGWRHCRRDAGGLRRLRRKLGAAGSVSGRPSALIRVPACAAAARQSSCMSKKYV